MHAEDGPYVASLGRRARASEERKQRVLRAANLCFSRGGYQKTAVEEIAEEAGVSKGLVFVFFGTKESLFQAVIAETLAEWRKFSEAEAERFADLPLEELRSLFTGSFVFVREHPMLSVLLGRSGRDWMAGSPDVARVNAAWRERLEQVIRKGIRVDLIKSDCNVALSAEVIHELQWSLLDRQLDAAKDRNFEPHWQLIETAIDLLINGLSAAGTVNDR
jgi:AcrR family transcriptional regulator